MGTGILQRFSGEFINNITRQLILGEGERLTAYRCLAGKLTVGIGHNCDAKPVQGVSKPGDTITREQSRALFADDLSGAIADVLRHYPWVSGLHEPRQAVVYDLCFNMGIGNGKRGLRSFTRTMPLIRQGNYAQAGRNIFASQYAKDVNSDGPGGRFDRVERLVMQLTSGEWVFER